MLRLVWSGPGPTSRFRRAAYFRWTLSNTRFCAAAPSSCMACLCHIRPAMLNSMFRVLIPVNTKRARLSS